jgi:hypothetical protein
MPIIESEKVKLSLSDDVELEQIISGTLVKGETRCGECGGTLPEESDVVLMICFVSKLNQKTLIYLCMSCALDDD